MPTPSNKGLWTLIYKKSYFKTILVQDCIFKYKDTCDQSIHSPFKI